MCGLVGLVSKYKGGFVKADADIFSQLLYIDALRGDDSTGASFYYVDGKIQTIKEASDASLFINTKEYQDTIDDFGKIKAVIGHNRKRTVGNITDETAHPFVENECSFIHNGTLTSWSHLNKGSNTDSHALAVHLTKTEGNVKKVEEALSNVYGAYACMWLDQKQEKLFIVRNVERPLYFVETSAFIAIASEQVFLACILLRNKIKVDQIQEIKVETLYSIGLSEDYGNTKLLEEKLTVKKATPPTARAGTVGGESTTPGTQKFYGTNFFKGTCTKTAFKKFKKEYIGKLFYFYIMDYWDHNANGTSDRWLCVGESMDIETDHTITCVIEGKTEIEMLELTSQLLVGRFINGQFKLEKDTPCFDLMFGDIKLHRYPYATH